jgi:glycerol-3-phosphate dehydrogenase
VTRDYQLDLDRSRRRCSHVWGGKLTTFRKLAEEVGDELAAPLGLRRTRLDARRAVPGGDLKAWIGRRSGPTPTSCASCQALSLRHPDLPGGLLHRLARAYGAGSSGCSRRRPRRRGRARPARGGARYLHDARVGAERRRRALAAQQARPAPDRGAARRSPTGAPRIGRRRRRQPA